ncbi:MAG: hypothetical protein ABSD89_11450 [Halobacteriota archaeon]|jgi:hypothetical protein
MEKTQQDLLIGTIDEFLKIDWTYARGYHTSTEPLALSIRSLAGTMKHKQANTEHLEQSPMCDDDARSQKRWIVGRSILSCLNNIVLIVQYCPKPFISARRGTGRSSFFFVHLTCNAGGAPR